MAFGEHLDMPNQIPDHQHDCSVESSFWCTLSETSDFNKSHGSTTNRPRVNPQLSVQLFGAPDTAQHWSHGQIWWLGFTWAKQQLSCIRLDPLPGLVETNHAVISSFAQVMRESGSFRKASSAYTCNRPLESWSASLSVTLVDKISCFTMFQYERDDICPTNTLALPLHCFPFL